MTSHSQRRIFHLHLSVSLMARAVRYDTNNKTSAYLRTLTSKKIYF